MRQTLFLFSTSLMALGGLLAGCTSETGEVPVNPAESVDEPAAEPGNDDVGGAIEFRDRREIGLSAESRAAAADLGGFYIDFTADMARYASGQPGSGEGNVVVSPLSMAMLLSMMANGIEAGSRDAFTDYLGTTDLEGLNDLCATLMRELPEADDFATFGLANSIWVNSGSGLHLTEGYGTLLGRVYGSDIRYDDFGDRSLVDRVNGWCSEKTGGLISDFLSRPPQGMALLLNALYFKDEWHDGIFSADSIGTGVFHGVSGERRVDMMRSEVFTGEYFCDDSFDYFTIPFGNRAFSLEILLPREGHVESIPGRETMELMYRYRSIWDLKVTLPKFKVENRYSVTDMLAATGHTGLLETEVSMFEGGGREVNILYDQATSFTLDENGSEVAAVTGGDICSSPMTPPPVLQMDVDRPFWFFIREYSTGACILSGRIANL